MGVILCPTRGGEQSHKAQDKAIELARETGDLLIFLYVVDAQFMKDTTAISRLSEATGELQRMGEFLLLAAQERAREAGVEAQAICRQGNVRETIAEVVKEYQAKTLVLGHSPRDVLERFFTLDDLREFAQRIEEKTGARVIIAE